MKITDNFTFCSCQSFDIDYVLILIIYLTLYLIFYKYGEDQYFSFSCHIYIDQQITVVEMSTRTQLQVHCTAKGQDDTQKPINEFLDTCNGIQSCLEKKITQANWIPPSTCQSKSASVSHSSCQIRAYSLSPQIIEVYIQEDY